MAASPVSTATGSSAKTEGKTKDKSKDKFEPAVFSGLDCTTLLRPPLHDVQVAKRARQHWQWLTALTAQVVTAADVEGDENLAYKLGFEVFRCGNASPLPESVLSALVMFLKRGVCAWSQARRVHQSSQHAYMHAAAGFPHVHR